MQAESAPALSRIQPWQALAAIVAVGAILRFLRLEHQSFWYDEAVSARFTTYPVLDVLLGRERDLGNPPLHYALLNLWSRLLGPSDAALRSLSAVASVAGIPLLYSVARRLTDTRVALVAAALLAISPPHVYFAQETRTYALATTLAMFSLDSLLRAEEDPRSPWPWVAYAASVFLCAYSHYFQFFFLAGHVAFVALMHRRDRPFLARWALSVAAAAALFAVVWLPSFYAQVTTKGNLARSADAWYLHLIGTPMVYSVGTTLAWKGAASWPRLAAVGVAMIAFGAAFVAGIAALRNHRRALAALSTWLLSPILIPFAISVALFPIYNARYSIIAAPAALVVCAAGLVHLSRLPRTLAAAAIVGTCTASLVLYFTTTVKHDWRSAAAWLDARAAQGDVIAFDVDTGESPFARYARSSVPRLRLVAPGRGDAAQFVGTEDRLDPPHDVAPQISRASRVWLVLSDPQDGSGGYYEGLLDKQLAAGPGAQFVGISITPYIPRR